jgi:dTDP-glucose 4,6-dehydratase
MAPETHVLVTGGAGFIGSHLVEALFARGDLRITVLDKLTYAGSAGNLRDAEGREGFELVRGDVADPDDVEPLVGVADRVIHAAAESHVDRSIAGPAEFVATNVVGTQVVLDACTRTRTPLLAISTDEVYGAGEEDSLFTETSPLSPRSPYAASKAAADLLCSAYRSTYGTAVTVVRGTNAYGPRQNPEKAIPTFALAALEGRPLPVYGGGEQRREWLHVKDWVAGCLTAFDRGGTGEIFNIGSGFELPNRDLARRICAIAGAPESLVGSVTDRLGHDYRYGLDDAKLRSLGWEPEIGFDEGLESTVRWYRDNASWVGSMRAEVM